MCKWVNYLSSLVGFIEVYCVRGVSKTMAHRLYGAEKMVTVIEMVTVVEKVSVVEAQNRVDLSN